MFGQQQQQVHYHVQQIQRLEGILGAGEATAHDCAVSQADQ